MRVPNRRRMVGGGVLVAAIALTVIVGPHFLRTSPTTNENTDPANGVEVAAACPAPSGEGAWLSLQPAPDDWHPTGSVEGAAAAAICYEPGSVDAATYRRNEAQLPEAEVSLLVADIGGRLTAQPTRSGGCADTGPSRLLVLSNDAGQELSFADRECTGEFAGELGYWVPSSAAEAVIADALGGAISSSERQRAE